VTLGRMSVSLCMFSNVCCIIGLFVRLHIGLRVVSSCPFIVVCFSFRVLFVLLGGCVWGAGVVWVVHWLSQVWGGLFLVGVWGVLLLVVAGEFGLCRCWLLVLAECLLGRLVAACLFGSGWVYFFALLRGRFLVGFGSEGVSAVGCVSSCVRVTSSSVDRVSNLLLVCMGCLAVWFLVLICLLAVLGAFAC